MKTVTAVVVVMFVVMHVLGAREQVGFLSGTRGGDVMVGVMYAATWFFTVLVAPVVVLSELCLSLRRGERSVRSTG